MSEVYLYFLGLCPQFAYNGWRTGAAAIVQCRRLLQVRVSTVKLKINDAKAKLCHAATRHQIRIAFACKEAVLVPVAPVCCACCTTKIPMLIKFRKSFLTIFESLLY